MLLNVVLDMVDTDDGGAIITVEVDEATLKRFAAIGIEKVLVEAAITNSDVESSTE